MFEHKLRKKDGGIKGKLREVKGDRKGKKILDEREGKLRFIKGWFYWYSNTENLLRKKTRTQNS